MFQKKNMLGRLSLVLLLLAASACDVLGFISGPPTEIPGATATGTSLPVYGTITPTVPGFPTLPAIETPNETLETETPITPLIPTETRPVEASIPLPSTSTPRPEPFFALQPGNPEPMINFIKPESGCNWMGIGGQILDLHGMPLVNYLIQVEGKLGDLPVSILALTGGTPQLGPGGYLIEISSQPLETSGMLYLSVMDLTGRVLSDKTYITTYSDCDKNLILANFSQLPKELTNRTFLPSITKE